MDKDTASIDPVTIIGDTTVKPFSVDFEQEAIDDLRLVRATLFQLS